MYLSLSRHWLKEEYICEIVESFSRADVKENGDYIQLVADRWCYHQLGGLCCLRGSSVDLFILVDKHSLSAQY